MPRTTKKLDIELPPEYFPLLKSILTSVDESKADSIRVQIEGPPDMLADDPIASISGDGSTAKESSPNSANGHSDAGESNEQRPAPDDISVEVHGGESTDESRDPPDGQLLKHVQREQADVSDAEATARARYYVDQRGSERPEARNIPYDVRPGIQPFYVQALLYRCHGFLTIKEISHLLEGTKWEVPYKSLQASTMYRLLEGGAVCRKKLRDRENNPHGYQLTQLGRDAMAAFCEGSDDYLMTVADNIAEKQHKLLREM